LRQFHGGGRRASHRPLLMLLALGRAYACAPSTLSWSFYPPLTISAASETTALSTASIGAIFAVGGSEWA